MSEESLDDILQRLGEAPSPGAILHVTSPSRGIEYHRSTGLFEREGDRALAPVDGYRIASTSKMFTGVIIMQLAEEGVLSTGDSAGDFIEVSSVPVAKGHSPEEISIQHLLTHTSGLWDFAMSDDWGRYVAANRDNFFNPRDTLAWAFEHGHAVGAPGEKYEYSDTGYVMLGLISEAVTGQTWGDLCRERILTPLGMNSTWLEGYESPASTLSHTYIGKYDGIRTHGSVDWAAGGHVSTTVDMCTFIQAMHRGELFQHKSTQEAWLDGVPMDTGGSYGAGVMIRKFGGYETIGHGGFWGSFLIHAPDLDTSVAGTVNVVGADRVSMLNDVITAVS